MTSLKNTSATNRTEAAARPRFLTIAQVAEELSVNEHLVRGLIKNLELRAFQVGGRGQWRIGRDDLEAYIAAAYERAAEQIAAELPSAGEAE